jgi:hypothetical protein
MARKRALRWQLYDQAVALGLKGRSGGYTVDFLKEFLKGVGPPPFDAENALFNKFSPVGDFIQAVDIFEQEHNVKILVQARKHHRDTTGVRNRFKTLKSTIKRIDRSDESLGIRNKPRRGSKPWSKRKRDFKARHNMSDEDWREYKRNKLNDQRRRALS